MDRQLTVWDLLLLLGIVVAIIVFTRVRAARRRRALATSVAQMGWTYAGSDAGALAPLAHLPLFQFQRATVDNVLRGVHGGRPMTVLDFTYTTGFGKHQARMGQTVFCTEVAEPGLPAFRLLPKGAVTKAVGAVVGLGDLDLSHHPAFAQLYLLRGDDEAALRALFTGAVLDFFAANPGLSVEGEGTHLIVYRSHKLVKPDDFPALLDQAARVAQVLEARAPVGKSAGEVPEAG